MLSKPIRLRGLKCDKHASDVVKIYVEAYTASWIEIQIVEKCRMSTKSKPIRLRGLKFVIGQSTIILNEVEAYTASWIEI